MLLGGGMLNPKTAFALLSLGIDVTMVEIEDSVLPWLMEADAAALIHNALVKAGLKVITGSTLSCLHYRRDSDGIEGVELSNGQELACQMLLIGIGVQPNISLLKSTPLKLNQGVIIDSRCACSEENVFAAGDVAVNTYRRLNVTNSGKFYTISSLNTSTKLSSRRCWPLVAASGR